MRGEAVKKFDAEGLCGPFCAITNDPSSVAPTVLGTTETFEEAIALIEAYKLKKQGHGGTCFVVDEEEELYPHNPTEIAWPL